jgi:hypothetical protein
MRRINAEYSEFVKRSAPTVNYMVKEFEMRKNASQLARAKMSKSGEINPKKLSRYSINSDIFERVMTVSQGKNHGLVVYIDLSGSMSSIIKNTIEQAIVLSLFCRKINIPFDIYGFSDDAGAKSIFFENSFKYVDLKLNDFMICTPSFHLKHLLSSSLSASDYQKYCKDLHAITSIISGQLSRYRDELVPSSFVLSGTPLDEALISSIQIVSDFKAKYRLDNVNCIFLTDGDANSRRVMYDGREDFTGFGWTGKLINHGKVYVQDAKQQVRIKLTNMYAYDEFAVSRTIIEIAKKVTGAKYTGYYIGSKKDLFKKVYSYYSNYSEAKKDLNSMLLSQGYISSQKYGFNEYFMVLPDNLKIEDTGIQVEAGASKNEIKKAFFNSMKGRGLQRMFLNKFMENIAA